MLSGMKRFRWDAWLEASGVPADHCGVAMGVLKQRIDSVGAANRLRDRMGRVECRGAGECGYSYSNFKGPIGIWSQSSSVLMGRVQGIIVLLGREDFGFRSRFAVPVLRQGYAS